MPNKNGLTRLQMIFAIALVLIFAGLSVPKIIDVAHKTREGATKYNLDRMRSAIAAYFGDNSGNYPTDDLTVLVPRYIERIPAVDVPGFPKSNAVRTRAPAGKGGWFYFNDKTNPRWGDIIVDVNAKDSSGKPWAEN